MHKFFSEPLYLWKEFKQTRTDGTSMRLRLFFFLFFFIIALMIGLFLILKITGSFSSREHEVKAWMKNELTHIDREIYQDFGKISTQGIALSKYLSSDMDKFFSDNKITASQIQQHPELIEPLLESQTNHLIDSLSMTKSSGVFIILDATVNTSIENSKNSRAGIFLKNSAPNIINSIAPSIRYLRGPYEVARNHNIDLLPQWLMEFDISMESFFDSTLEHARKSMLPISRLYYWSPSIILKDNSESGVLLCVPITGKDGTVYGICGFEVSSMLFKLSYSLDNNSYSRAFAILTPILEDRIDSDLSLITNNYYSSKLNFSSETINSNSELDYFTCQSKDNTKYHGISKSVNLYPSDSYYANQEWKVSIMMPSSDYQHATSKTTQIYIYSFVILFLFSLFAVFFISRKYISPVVDALHQMKSGSFSQYSKTKILEIDDLIEFLAKQDNQKDSPEFPAKQDDQKDSFEFPVEQDSQKDSSSNLPDIKEAKKGDTSQNHDPDLSTYHAFISNIQTLSPAERAVFNLYMRGHTADEITKILCLSINTIKTHNKRIYMKLNVSSRNELMVYVNMMQKMEDDL